MCKNKNDNFSQILVFLGIFEINGNLRNDNEYYKIPNLSMRL